MCSIIAAACCETNHPMQERKYRPAIADSIYGLVRDLDPAISNGNALPFQAEEHRRCILNVDVEIRLRLGQRRGEVTEASVVEIKYRIKLASLHMEQGAMPPEMMHDIVGTRPMALQPLEEGDPFAVSALHLQDMGDRMGSPEVRRVDFHGGSAGLLRRGIVTALLVCKA